MTFPSVPPPGPDGRVPQRAALSRRAVLRGGALGGAALFSLAGFRRDSGAAAGTGQAPGTGGARAAAGTGAGPGVPGADAALTATTRPNSAARSYDFNQGWLFGGVYADGSEQPGYQDSGFTQVTLPHTVAPLSWGGWDHTTWENVWIYRKHFAGSDVRDGRVFADFDGAATNAAVVLNGVTVATMRAATCRFPPS